jgi:hypothetical protein
MRASQGLQPHLGQAPMQDLSLGHEVFDRSRHVPDRDLRVNTVLVEQVDAVAPKRASSAAWSRAAA